MSTLAFSTNCLPAPSEQVNKRRTNNYFHRSLVSCQRLATSNEEAGLSACLLRVRTCACLVNVNTLSTCVA